MIGTRELTTLAFAVAALTLSAVSVAQSDENGPLKTTMDSFLVSVDKKGKETVAPTKEAEPGQVIQYRIGATNMSKAPLRGLVINGPIPANTKYQAKSNKAQTAHNFLVSIDGGATWDKEPVKRKRKDKDGKIKEVVIGPEEYTHTRWVVKSALGPKKKLEFTYRVKVD